MQVRCYRRTMLQSQCMLARNWGPPGFGRLSPEVGGLLLVPLAENRGTAGLALLVGAGMTSAAVCSAAAGNPSDATSLCSVSAIIWEN